MAIWRSLTSASFFSSPWLGLHFWSQAVKRIGEGPIKEADEDAQMSRSENQMQLNTRLEETAVGFRSNKICLGKCLFVCVCVERLGLQYFSHIQ